MSTTHAKLYDTPSIGTAIHIIRNTRVILDADLARFYGVATKALNQAVKRNADRFPVDFAFQFTDAESDNLRSQFVTSSWGGRRHLPMVFTEHGVCHGGLGAELADRTALAKQLKAIDKKLLTHDAALLDLYEKLEPLLLPPPTPKKPIGFIREKQARYRV